MAAGAITLGDGTQLIGRALATARSPSPRNTIRFTTALPPVIAIDGRCDGRHQGHHPDDHRHHQRGVGATVTVTVAGQMLTARSQAGGTWSVTATALTAGTHTVVGIGA